MYSEKAIERLIEEVSVISTCYTKISCPIYASCNLLQKRGFLSEFECKKEIKRVLTEWSEEE